MTIDLDESKIQRNEFGMWLGWILATIMGLLLGFVLPALVINNINLGLARILVPLWAGFLVGLLQFAVLSRYMTSAYDWILHGGAGYALAYALGMLIIQLLGSSFWGLLIGYLLFGAVIALIQWPVLRREIPHVLPWVLANIVGWALGFFLSSLVIGWLFRPVQITLVLASLVTAIVTGLIAGAVTGVALIYITRQPEAGEVVRRAS